MESKYGFRSNETLLGIILILVGVSLLTDKLIIFNVIWQVLVIVWGLLLLKEHNLIQGIVVLSFGIIFLIDTIVGLNITYTLLGIGSMGLGIKVIFANLR